MSGGWLNIAMALLVAALASPPATVADALKHARELYAQAEYERALSVLDSLQADRSEARHVAEYRAYCLLALGKGAEAEEAIAAVVAADPLYRPSGAEVSPRVRNTFHDIRRRMLPDILQRKYVAAKALFDAKDFPGARDGFDEVLTGLADDDVADGVTKPPLADLRTLAAGFRELSAKAAIPPPIPARTESLSLNSVPRPPRVYDALDARVIAPTIVQQSVPPFVMPGFAPTPGVLEVLIDESGAVESASMRVPMNPRYDPQLVEAAREWKFTPATIEGVPVKYRKMMQVAVSSGR
jgi:tetratricopeptide (TPR) repeat protein